MVEQVLIRGVVMGVNPSGQKLVQPMMNGADGLRIWTDDKCLISMSDVARVVRCKDCKHYKSYGKSLRGFEAWGKCLQIDMDVDMPTNGYCCFGERESDAK